MQGHYCDQLLLNQLLVVTTNPIVLPTLIEAIEPHLHYHKVSEMSDNLIKGLDLVKKTVGHQMNKMTRAINLKRYQMIQKK
jgi:hypothetical protein